MSDEKTAEKVIRRLVEEGVYEDLAQLRSDIAILREQLELADDKIFRLRGVIKRESSKHNIFNKPECKCDVCLVARGEEP